MELFSVALAIIAIILAIIALHAAKRQDERDKTLTEAISTMRCPECGSSTRLWADWPNQGKTEHWCIRCEWSCLVDSPDA